jgi:uncharacterized protein (DUF433 family)
MKSQITKGQGGDACIGNSRMQVWVLAGLKWAGSSDRDLLEAYPTLTEEDLEAAWAYLDGHREEIETALEENGRKIPEDLGGLI